MSKFYIGESVWFVYEVPYNPAIFINGIITEIDLEYCEDYGGTICFYTIEFKSPFIDGNPIVYEIFSEFDLRNYEPLFADYEINKLKIQKEKAYDNWVIDCKPKVV